MVKQSTHLFLFLLYMLPDPKKLYMFIYWINKFQSSGILNA